MKNIRSAKGFTLIELMVTVVIVGILAIVAIPAYQDYVARSQVSEGLGLASGAKSLVAEYYADHGGFADASTLGFNGYTGTYINQTTIDANGNIIATFGSNANTNIAGQTVTLTPSVAANSKNLLWDCTSSIAAKYLPSSCTHVDPAKTPQELAYQGTGTYGINGRSMTYANGAFSTAGRYSTFIGLDNDGTQHFTLANYNLALTPQGDVMEVNTFTPNKTVISYNMLNSNGLFFSNTNYNVTDPSTGQNIVLHSPSVNVNISYYSTIANASNALFTAAANANSSVTSDNIAAYNTALSDFKTALNQVKAQNGGTYPSDWSADFLKDWATY